MMIRSQWLIGFGLVCAAVLAGCGGSGPSAARTATITGRITDIDGRPVRGAVVSAPGAGSTTTTTSGAYLLSGVPAEDLIVTATLTSDGVDYRGKNLVRAFDAEQASNVNIVIAPTSQLASIHGHVSDLDGNPLRGASVFAYGGSAFSSNRVVTNSNGNFEMEDLIAGVSYELSAGGADYSSDSTAVTLTAGESKRIDFTLGDPGNPALEQVTGLDYISYVSQPATRGSREARAAEQIKRLMNRHRGLKNAKTRLSTDGNLIEVELSWVTQVGEDVLGYKIYRAAGDGPFGNIDLVRDPLNGQYIDSDTTLLPARTYDYEVSAVGSSYFSDSSQEGELSDTLSVQTLDDLIADRPSLSPLTFRWRNLPSAESYVVYLFDRYPDYGVESIWSNEDDPTTGTSLAYNAGGLDSGTYYFVVVGLADGLRARSISQVVSFEL